MTLFDLNERELKYGEFLYHIGERLHYRIEKGEYFPPEYCEDEFVTLTRAEVLEDGWLSLEFQPEDGGKPFKWISNPTNDKHKARSHMFLEVKT